MNNRKLSDYYGIIVLVIGVVGLILTFLYIEGFIP